MLSSIAVIGVGLLLVRQVSIGIIETLAIVILGTYSSYKVYTYRLLEKNRHIQEIARVHLSTIECLATAIDAKDQVTHGHIRRVQIYTREMAMLLSLSDSEMEGLRAAALLHDIGKLGVPEYILNKPAKLTPQEFEKVKTHTLVGADILSAVEFPYPVVPGVLHHHERWDGNGYPSGLKGEEIPLAARILALADFYDALTSDRPYRRALSQEKVIEIIKEESGKMFDPKLVDLFCERIDSFQAAIHANGSEEPQISRRRNTPQLKAGKTESEVPVVSSAPRSISIHQEMLAFSETVRNSGCSMEMDDLLDIACNKVERLAPFTDLVIYLYDPKTDALIPAHISGPHKEIIEGHSVLRGHAVSGWALANRQSLTNANPHLDFRKEILNEVKKLCSLSVFPLFQELDDLGCLSLYSTDANALALEHAYLLELFCKKLSEAIAAMRMRQQALRAFFIDELTGLPDARYLYSNVEQELAKAKHDKSQLSLLALDLDEFKRINKQYGFQAGDQVLRTAAIALRNSCRETDTLVRYAGNEFITVLRNTGPLEAQILMSRLQHVIANLKPRLETTTRVAVRLNVGHSSYPDDGNTLEELLSQAERRMYDNGIKHSRKVSRPLRKRVGKQPDLS